MGYLLRTYVPMLHDYTELNPLAQSAMDLVQASILTIFVDLGLGVVTTPSGPTYYSNMQNNLSTLW